MPSRLNGTELSPTEFRDGLRLRYGLTPQNLPDQCDGCHERFTVDHAMSCRRGGLIIQRHDDIKMEFQQLCAYAFKPSVVSNEPIIPQARTQQMVNGQLRMVDPPEKRGDIAVHGFWTHGTTAIFDIRVTDTDARSHRDREPIKVLAAQEREKKNKYKEACLQARKHFTPLVFSIDGMFSKETKAACKNVAYRLTDKWKRPYSMVAGMVRARLTVALIRSASRCLRAERCRAPYQPLEWIEGAGLRLFR